MRLASAYRYFLCFVPDARLRQAIALLHRRTHQAGGRVAVERAHLSLCVFGEPAQPDPALAGRVDAALSAAPLASCVIRLGRVRGGPGGATLFTRGRKGDLTVLRRQVLARLAAHGVIPEFEKTSPHLTLGYDAFRGPAFDFTLEWIPRTIVLIESEHGLTRHNRLGEWPLLPPAQGMLPFGEGLGGLRLAS